MEIQDQKRPALYVDESAHPDSKLEWWFVHGRFSAEQVEERYFMASIFRFQVAGEDGQPITAFSALISILDPRSGRQWTSSRVDRRVVEAVSRPGTARSVDPFSPRVILDELREYGLPREFECPDAAPMLVSAPLHFEWADLTLASRSDGVVLSFQEPGTLRLLDLELRVEAPRLTIEAARSVGEPEEAMEYVSYPRVHLKGSAGGLAVEGEAWIDHQWGGSGMLKSQDSSPRVRGWDWLGFTLDEGSAWVVYTHWDGRSRTEFSRYLTVRDHSGNVQVCRSFEWEPVRWWTSPATRVRHPVEWKLRVPELGADLVFVPFADNQEIRVLGPQRAIWEGAGRVRGHLRGLPVEGPARLEGQGRGYVFGASEYLHGWAELVDRELAEFLPQTIEERDLRRYAGPPAWAYEPSSYTSVLAGPLWDLIHRDGKRWRGVFSYLLLDALGRNPEPLRDVAFVLPELLHNASLIIDDIQDDSPLRRGEEAIHRRYGLDVAISAANTAYFLPLLLVIDHPVLTKEEKQATCESYQRALVRAHLGQSLDLYWTRNLSATQLDRWMADSIGSKILQMYALKTAAPVVGLAEAAALLARAGEGTRHAVLQFAHSFGLAFQLVDDVKNFSDAPTWGKQRGEDLRTGKLTYLILSALEMLAPPERNLLRDILCQADLRCAPEGLSRGIELIVNSGACERLREEARARVAPAWDALSQFLPPSSSKTELRFLWESLVGLSAEDRDPLQS